MSTQLGNDPGNFYVWRASDGFAIHLSLNMVTQLTAQISRAGNESQPGGMRGILLGRSIDTPFRATVIEDFKLIPAGADASQPPDCDDALFEIACRMAGDRERSARSGLLSSPARRQVEHGTARSPDIQPAVLRTGKVALLIQTSGRGNESDAALFYWQQDGSPHPHDFGFGFPLDAGQLAKGHPGWRYPDPLDYAPTPATAPAPRRRRQNLRMLQWMPPAAVSASPERNTMVASDADGCASGDLRCGAAISDKFQPHHRCGVRANETAGPKARHREARARQSPARGWGLPYHATHQLEIRWNRQSAVIAASDKGVMKITEDGITEAVPFDQPNLATGTSPIRRRRLT